VHVDELRRMRKERGISQAELAARSGVDRSTISQIESGSREPQSSTLRRLAVVLGVGAGDLLAGDDPRFRTEREIEEALPRVMRMLEGVDEEVSRIRRRLYEEREEVPNTAGVLEELRRVVSPEFFEGLLRSEAEREEKRETGA
jgi:transcriptional regulator with XRE-family HTH domain